MGKRVIIPRFSIDQSHIAPRPYLPSSPAGGRSIVFQPPPRSPGRHNTLPLRLCKCGNQASNHDGFCRKCRPKAQPKPRQKQQKKSKRNTVVVRVPVVKVQGYETRKQILSGMGFDSYAAYLESSLWKSIRRKVLCPGAVCVKCRQAPNQVHHSTYTEDNLSGRSLVGLHPVCRPCHESAEIDQHGKKLSIKAANVRLGIATANVHRPKKPSKRRHDARRRTFTAKTSRCACGQPVLLQGQLCSLCLTKRTASELVNRGNAVSPANRP